MFHMHCDICNAISLNKFYVKWDYMGWGCGLSILSRKSKLASEFCCRLGTDTKDFFFFFKFPRCLGSWREGSCHWEWRAGLNRRGGHRKGDP